MVQLPFLAILGQGGVRGQQLAMLSLGLDYLFLLLYPSLICVGLLLLAPALTGWLRRCSSLLAWAALGAGLTDAVENHALVQVLLTGVAEPCGGTAGVFAAVRFTIFGVTLAWLLLMFAAPVWRQRGRATA